MKCFVFIITWVLVASVPRDNQAQVSELPTFLRISLGFSKTNCFIFFKLLPEIVFHADMINLII